MFKTTNRCLTNVTVFMATCFEDKAVGKMKRIMLNIPTDGKYFSLIRLSSSGLWHFEESSNSYCLIIFSIVLTQPQCINSTQAGDNCRWFALWWCNDPHGEGIFLFKLLPRSFHLIFHPNHWKKCCHQYCVTVPPTLHSWTRLNRKQIKSQS